MCPGRGVIAQPILQRKLHRIKGQCQYVVDLTDKRVITEEFIFSLDLDTGSCIWLPFSHVLTCSRVAT